MAVLIRYSFIRLTLCVVAVVDDYCAHSLVPEYRASAGPEDLSRRADDSRRHWPLTRTVPGGLNPVGLPRTYKVCLLSAAQLAGYWEVFSPGPLTLLV